MTVKEICEIWNRHDAQIHRYSGNMRIEWLQRTRDAMLQLIEKSDWKIDPNDFVVYLEMVAKDNFVWIEFRLKPRSEI